MSEMSQPSVGPSIGRISRRPTKDIEAGVSPVDDGSHHSIGEESEETLAGQGSFDFEKTLREFIDKCVLVPFLIIMLLTLYTNTGTPTRASSRAHWVSSSKTFMSLVSARPRPSALHLAP